MFKLTNQIFVITLAASVVLGVLFVVLVLREVGHGPRPLATAGQPAAGH